MKINCTCGATIVDQTDYLKTKGYTISDTQWFDFWDAIDAAVEQSGSSKEEKERACMQLRKQHLFKTVWECTNCGKLFVDSENGELLAYSPDSENYNAVLDKKE